MNIKKIIIAAMVLPCLLAGCAKEEETDSKTAAKNYFLAWMQVNYPGVDSTGSGIYIVEDRAGRGEAWDGTKSSYAFVQYTIRSLDGTISDTNEESVAKQLLTYDPSYYYGPKVWPVGQYYCYAGVEEALSGMQEGGSRRVVIPSWLLTYNRYSSEAEYLSHASTSVSNAIYSFTLTGQTDNIYSWQAGQLEQYAREHMNGADSTHYGGVESAPKYGFYFHTLEAGESGKDIPADSTFYINYTGRRLADNQVFDTTIDSIAKVYHIYSASKTYAPVSIKKGSNYSSMTMGASGSSVITGFGAALYRMHPYEKAVAAFYSALGYGAQGSGSLIPGYSPLIFEIELVDAP